MVLPKSLENSEVGIVTTEGLTHCKLFIHNYSIYRTPAPLYTLGTRMGEEHFHTRGIKMELSIPRDYKELLDNTFSFRVLTKMNEKQIHLHFKGIIVVSYQDTLGPIFSCNADGRTVTVTEIEEDNNETYANILLNKE